MTVADTNILSYLARSACLPGFLAALAGEIASTPLVRAELERGVQAGHAALETALAAFADGRIALVDLDQAELTQMVALREQRRGLSLTDCSLLVVALTRRARLLTYERRLQRAAVEHGVAVATLIEILDQVVAAGYLTPAQRDAVLAIAQA